jgi:hypothetical protein
MVTLNSGTGKGPGVSKSSKTSPGERNGTTNENGFFKLG